MFVIEPPASVARFQLQSSGDERPCENTDSLCMESPVCFLNLHLDIRDSYYVDVSFSGLSLSVVDNGVFYITVLIGRGRRDKR